MAVGAADAGGNHLDNGAVRTLATRLGAVREHEGGVGAILDGDVLARAYETKVSECIRTTPFQLLSGREEGAVERRRRYPET